VFPWDGICEEVARIHGLDEVENFFAYLEYIFVIGFNLDGNDQNQPKLGMICGRLLITHIVTQPL